MGLSGDQREKIEKRIAEQFEKAATEGKTLVIGGATTFHKAATADEVRYFDTRRFAREELLAIFGVPPPIVGIYDAATLQNFDNARRIWWTTSIFPRKKVILQAFNRQAIRAVFGGDVRLWFTEQDSDIGLDIMKRKAEVASIFVGDLGYPTNVAAAHINLGIERVPGLDIVNARFITAGRVWDPGGIPIGDVDGKEQESSADGSPQPALALVADDEGPAS